MTLPNCLIKIYFGLELVVLTLQDVLLQFGRPIPGDFVQNLKILHVDSNGRKLNALEYIYTVRDQNEDETSLTRNLTFACLSSLLRLITDYNWNF
jgi:hypothetical protein